MAEGIIDIIRQKPSALTVVKSLIIINVGIFILLRIGLLMGNSETLIDCLSLSNSNFHLWTPITYMFVHIHLLHLTGNIVTFYIAGYFLSRKISVLKLITVYFASGIGGALSFIMFQNGEGSIVGASSAVMGILTFAAIAYRNKSFTLPFPGKVSVTAVMIIFLILHFALIAGGGESTVLAVHSGGIISGILCALIISFIGVKDRKRQRAELERINEKVRKSGFSSLTFHEREIVCRKN